MGTGRWSRTRARLSPALLLLAVAALFVSSNTSAAQAERFSAAPTSVPSAAARLASVGRLRISATLTHVGYVGVTLAGPRGATVELREGPAKSSKPIRTLTLGSQGAQLPHAVIWTCNARRYDLIATTLPPAIPEQATVNVVTPGCSDRLAVGIAPKALVGHAASIVLQDRWRTGSLPVTICVTPPGAAPACQGSSLAPGQSRRVVHVAVPRPGGWRFAVGTRFGYRMSTMVWASHHRGPLRVLLVGDSEMQILDGDLTQDLTPHGVNVTSDAQLGTGLTLTYAFNWEDTARRQAATLRPDVTVMFIGANDAYVTTGPGGQTEYCCGPAWSRGYADLVAEMMRSYLRGTAGRVYWFVLPTPRSSKFRYLFNGVNAGIRLAAARFPGRVSLIDANAFFTPGNRYRDYMTFQGHGFTIHQPDGIHLTTTSDLMAAALVVKQLVADRVIT